MTRQVVFSSSQIPGTMSIDEFSDNLISSQARQTFNRLDPDYVSALEDALDNTDFEFYKLPSWYDIEDIDIATNVVNKGSDAVEFIVELSGFTELPHVLVTNNKTYKDFDYELNRTYVISVSSELDWDVSTKDDNSYKHLMHVLSELDRSEDGIFIEIPLNRGVFGKGYCKHPSQIDELVDQILYSRRGPWSRDNRKPDSRNWPIPKYRIERDTLKFLGHEDIEIVSVSYGKFRDSMAEKYFVNELYEDREIAAFDVEVKYRTKHEHVRMDYQWHERTDQWWNLQMLERRADERDYVLNQLRIDDDDYHDYVEQLKSNN